MSRTTVVSLGATQYIDQTAVGPKAMSLIRLRRIGLAVPRGFCVTATALQEHLERNNLVDFTKATVTELAKADLQAKGAILAGLRAAIIKPSLAEEVRREIETHYRALAARNQPETSVRLLDKALTAAGLAGEPA